MTNKRTLSPKFKDGLTGALFASPFIIGFILFILSPLVMYCVMSVSKLTLSDAGTMVFINVGLENFADVLLRQSDFLTNLSSSLRDFIITCPAVILYSLFIAILINKKFVGRTFFRSVFFLPVIISSGVALMFQNDALAGNSFAAVGGARDGTLNLTSGILDMLGSGQDNTIMEIVSFLMDKVYYITGASGVQILIFLAGLQSISPQLYEASSIEGCSGWENFWKITLPMISPMILVNAVYTIIDILGSPLNYIINKLYTLSITNGNYGLSAAMGLLYFAVIFAILGLAFVVINRFVFYEEKL